MHCRTRENAATYPLQRLQARPHSSCLAQNSVGLRRPRFSTTMLSLSWWVVVDEGEHTVCLPSVTWNVVVNGGWSLMRGVVNEGFYCTYRSCRKTANAMRLPCHILMYSYLSYLSSCCTHIPDKLYLMCMLYNAKNKFIDPSNWVLIGLEIGRYGYSTEIHVRSAFYVYLVLNQGSRYSLDKEHPVDQNSASVIVIAVCCI